MNKNKIVLLTLAILSCMFVVADTIQTANTKLSKAQIAVLNDMKIINPTLTIDYTSCQANLYENKSIDYTFKIRNCTGTQEEVKSRVLSQQKAILEHIANVQINRTMPKPAPATEKININLIEENAK